MGAVLTRSSRWGTLAAVLLVAGLHPWVSPARAQMDESCTASVRGFTVDVQRGGGFHVRNVPAGSELVRASVVCSRDGQLLYGRSEPFEVEENKTYYVVGDISLSETPPRSIVWLSAAADEAFLTSPFARTQVRVTAQLDDGSTMDVTARELGTTYSSSNPGVATVDPNGLVSAAGRGVACISAVNEGTTAATCITVRPGEPLTTVEGRVQREDGTPASGAFVTTARLGGLALTGADGKFSMPGILAGFGEPILTLARINSTTPPLFGRANGPAPVPAGITDVGTIVLRPLCDMALEEFGSLITLVFALEAFDDGTGPDLYAGGAFDMAGPVATRGIARWDGTSWSALGSGMNETVYALEAVQETGGAALYAGGEMTMAGGVSASHIARWNGTTWSALGTGTDRPVRALAVYDDGRGPALYAAGDFSLAGGAPASFVARWDGASWSALGTGTDGPILALAVFDDGRGPALYAAGGFTRAGTVPAAGIARWDGLAWSALGSGIAGLPGALAVYNDGTGPALYVAGDFSGAGGVPASHIARWDGGAWSNLSSGMDQPVLALTVFDDGTVPALIAGGGFTMAGGSSAKGVARWDGTSWAPIVPGFNNGIFALTVFDDGSGSDLYGSQFINLVRWYRPTTCVR